MRCLLKGHHRAADQPLTGDHEIAKIILCFSEFNRLGQGADGFFLPPGLLMSDRQGTKRAGQVGVGVLLDVVGDNVFQRFDGFFVLFRAR